MKLKFLGCIIDAQEGAPWSEEGSEGVQALALSPNGRRLAAAVGDSPHVQLFDERAQRRDRFATKPADPKYGKRSYALCCLAFSPDSTRLAVGQSDNIVFVYRLGETWEEKKVICNKFGQSAAVSALLWPEESRLVIGLRDGKVRAGSAHSNKCATLYRLDAGVVSLALHPSRRTFVSGHEDGAIVIYSLESRTQTKVCVHSTAPYCLALCASGILAAGADRRIVSYGADSGRVLQNFDFDDGGSDFYACAADPTGQSVIFGSFDRMRLLCWNERRGAWTEDAVLDLRHFHTVTTLVWKADGTTIVAGGSAGAVAHFDCCIRRALLRGRFEVTYISPSQAFIRDARPPVGVVAADGNAPSASCVVRSAKNLALSGLRVCGGRDGARHFAVAHTPHTLIVADLQNALCSEVQWQWSGAERFYFDNDNVCLVINAGEINFIEYGANEPLGWIRTERVNPHLVSVRVSSTPSTGAFSRRVTPRGGGASARSNGAPRVCRVAYLLDVHTIAVVNLQNNVTIAHITHQNAIDWIELNESAQKLLFRDVGSALYVCGLPSEANAAAAPPRCLLGYCFYAQWVPRSDVVVAQSADQLCVWYNIDGGGDTSAKSAGQQNVVRLPIQGEVEAVLRDEHRTEVIVVENNARVAYELDGAMVEFGTALNERDLSRALVFLERCERAQHTGAAARRDTDEDADDPALAYELTPMWQRLADAALADGALLIAQRCYAALADYPKVRFLQETIERAEWALQEREAAARHASYRNAADAPDAPFPADGMGGFVSAGAVAAHFETRARVALLHKDFKRAERIYLENGAGDAAVEMYRRLGQWEAAVELATATGYSRLDALKQDYYRMLSSTGQMERVAEMRAQEGDIREAIDICLEAGRPAHAARLLLDDANKALFEDRQLVERLIDVLTRHEQFERVAQLYEATRRYEPAVENFRRAGNFAKAVHVARHARPDAVVALEEQWADALAADGAFDAAVNHYLESGQSLKAADAAIRAKEWDRAIEILSSLNQRDDASDGAVSQHCIEIARHFEADGEYERAEKFFLDGGRPADAVEMYNRAARWADAYRLAAAYFGADESHEIYAQKAEELKAAGRLTEAEQLFIGIGEPTRAIAMYKAVDRREDVVRLVARFHPDRTKEMHKRLAEECEERGDLKTAEEHYLAAGDWNSALEMYREAQQFADAFRVAKAATDGEAATRAASAVAYAWAKSLGGEAAVKLLTRYTLLHDAIDVGLTKGDFEFVFELCNLGMKERLAEAQQKYAEHLEDEGNFAQAEEFYLKADKIREAMLMYVHNEDWTAAERLAGVLSDEELADVLVARGQAALADDRPAEAESYFLRAGRADVIMTHYREMGAWADALRIAAKYAPDAFDQLQHDYQLSEAARGGAVGATILFEQAANCERQGDYQRAVDCYWRVDERDSENFVRSQIKAAELIAKFLAVNEGLGRVREIGERLAAGNHHTAAADVFLLGRMGERAVEALVQAQEWNRARRIAADVSPAMVNEVESAYRAHLRAQGRVGELADVDASAAVDLLAERGDWEAALTAARQHNDRPLLDRHLLERTGQLADAGAYADAARLFLRYGVSTATAAFNLYKFIIDMSVNSRSCDYDTCVTLRDMLAALNVKFTAESATVDPRIVKIFERYEFALHLYAFRTALAPPAAEGNDSAARLRLQQSVALLRFVDLFQPDKVFFEAGNTCREYSKEYENLGFVLLNHCLDVVDAIEEGDATLVDNTIFEGTDVPQNYAIPDAVYLTAAELEDVKEWVLATSVGRNVEKQLKTDERGVFEASGIDSSGQRPICVVSGYPILDPSHIKQLGSGRVADSSSWNAFNGLTRDHANEQLFNVQEYLMK